MPLITSLLIVGGGAAVAAFTARNERRRRVAVMRTIAERRNGSFDTGGWFGEPSVRIPLGDGIAVTAVHHQTKNTRYTKFEADMPAPGLPVCKVSPAGFVAHVAHALGAQDIEVGHPQFDDVFVVKGNDPAMVKRLWSRPFADLMSGAFPTSTFECMHREIRFVWPVIADVGQMETAIDFLVDLARSDPYALAMLPTLPEAQLRHGDRFTSVELPGPSRIQIGPVERDGIVRTCVRSAAIGTVPADAETQVTSLGATLEQTEHELQIWWPTVEADPKRLVAATELLRRLAAGPALGVFR